MKRNFFILFMLLSSFWVFSQKNLLDGIWKLDGASIVKNSDNSVIEFDKVKQNPYFGLFEGLIFQEDNLIVIENGYEIKGTPEITNDKIEIPFTDAPIEAQYQIKNGQLFLEQRVSYPGEGHSDNDLYIVSTKYKKQ